MYLDSSLEEDRTPLILAGVFGVSLLLHLMFLVAAFWFSPLMINFEPAPPTATRINIKLVKTPSTALSPLEPAPKQSFVDTGDSIPTNKPLPTPFEGETSTMASSTQSGQGNTALPNQTGVDSRSLNLRNQDYSPENEAKAAAQTPSTQQAQPKEQGTPAEQAKQATSRELPQNIPLRSTGIISTGEKPKNPTEKKTQEASATTQSTTAAQSMPPAMFSAQKRTTAIDGGAAIGDAASLGVQESEMGRYKAKLYRAIGSRWYIYVRQDSAQVSIGVVKIRFKVSSAGEISDLQVVEGASHAALLNISRRSILDLKTEFNVPFPPSMQEQIGDFYWEEVTFTIY
jgi:outer membrane biosynthesis protein TonB